MPTASIKLQNLAGKRPDCAGSMTERTIYATDLKENRPLPHERAIRPQQRPGWILKIGRFRRNAIQLDDREVFAGLEAIDVGVSHVKSSEIEALKRPRDLIDLE